MSKMLVQCPTCQARIRVSERLLGKTKPCPRCQTVLQFPAEMAATSEAEAAAGGESAYPADSPPRNPSPGVGPYAPPSVPPPHSNAPSGFAGVPIASPSSGMSATTSPPAYTASEWVEELQVVPQVEYSPSTRSSLPRLPMKRRYPALVIISYILKIMACITFVLYIIFLLIAFIGYLSADNLLEKAASWYWFSILLYPAPIMIIYCISLWALAEIILMMIHFEENLRAIGICMIEISKKYLS